MIEVATPPFRLYPEERRWWSMLDYGAVLGVMRHLQPKTVLEFGPGSSTLALLEGGATTIHSCEDNPDWEQVYRARLEQAYPDIVRILPYTFSDPIHVPGIAPTDRYDMALIDGPYTTPLRPVAIAFALAHCEAVLVPTEDEGRKYKSYLRPFIEQLAEAAGYGVEYMETGPLSGGFALLTRRPAPFTETLEIPGESGDVPVPVYFDVGTPITSPPKSRKSRKRKGQRPKGEALC